MHDSRTGSKAIKTRRRGPFEALQHTYRERAWPKMEILTPPSLRTERHRNSHAPISIMPPNPTTPTDRPPIMETIARLKRRRSSEARRTNTLENILKSGEPSDFKITCKGKEWNVHKATLRPQSDYFSAILNSGFRETKEAALDLSSDEVEHVEQMLKFLYSGDYDDLCPEKTENTRPDNTEETTTESQDPVIESAKRDIHLYVMGDKYLIGPLKEKATAKLRRTLPWKWKESFWPLVDLIVETTPPSATILDPIMDLWVEIGMALVEDDEFNSKITQYPTLELRFLRRLIRKIRVDLHLQKRTITSILTHRSHTTYIRAIIEAAREAAAAESANQATDTNDD
ncbi:hypothetical protein Dda_8723 [Drechslerella dactyloides]|uniref:BTB domain-containing protein n=1 Tax=Drechslerella dactyloides TaxID=74499 RepID=A0AAD6NG31_DREDA|nr:hypothetical protein Dda_8723 [Drechslerella dactyloides]